MNKTHSYSDGSTPTICIIGAGYSGIAAGIKLKSKLGLTSFTIFDENYEVGGTWLVNTYPGCACDVVSHLYSLSFEPNSNWSSNYPSREEIWMYLKGIASKNGLYKHIRFNTQVMQLDWVENLGKWRVNYVNTITQEAEEIYFDLIINGPGGLRVPNIPKEFHAFKGPMIHSGKWDSSIDLNDKVIGIVGSGSSAIQLIPHLAEVAKELHCYQRHPAWVLPQFQFKFPELIKKIFYIFPLLLWIYRCFLFLMNEIGYIAFLHKSVLSYVASWTAIEYLKSQINDKTLVKKLIPNYKFGCKRITLSTMYFNSMKQLNVSLHREPIEEVLVDGIKISNEVTKLDVLILATGFKVHEYFAPLKIIGKNSVDLLSEWMNYRPTGYLGIVSSLAPNQFGLLGPSKGLGHNSAVFMIECQVNYIMELIKEMMRRDASVITVKETEEKIYQNFIDKGMEKTVWGNEKCGSWYAVNGTVTVLWPETATSYWKKLYKPNFNHYDFVPR